MISGMDLEEQGDRLRVTCGGTSVRLEVYAGKVVHLLERDLPKDLLSEIAEALWEHCRLRGREVLSEEGPPRTDWNDALREAGFRDRAKKLLVSRGLGGLPPGDAVFAWRTLAEIGDAAFLVAAEEAAQGDPFEEGEPRDPEARFREHLEYAGRHLDRTLWRVALFEGEAVGVVLAQPFGEVGTLASFGIFPAHRGKGLGGKLHRAGLALLQGAGVKTYKGSTDVRNAPMARIFERNGCRVATVQVFFRPGAE